MREQEGERERQNEGLPEFRENLLDLVGAECRIVLCALLGHQTRQLQARLELSCTHSKFIIYVQEVVTHFIYSMSRK